MSVTNDLDLLGLAALRQVGSLSLSDLEPTDAHSFLRVLSAKQCIYSYACLHAPRSSSKACIDVLSAWKQDENMTKTLQPSDSWEGVQRERTASPSISVTPTNVCASNVFSGETTKHIYQCFALTFIITKQPILTNAHHLSHLTSLSMWPRPILGPIFAATCPRCQGITPSVFENLKRNVSESAFQWPVQLDDCIDFTSVSWYRRYQHLTALASLWPVLAHNDLRNRSGFWGGMFCSCVIQNAEFSLMTFDIGSGVHVYVMCTLTFVSIIAQLKNPFHW